MSTFRTVGHADFPTVTGYPSCAALVAPHDNLDLQHAGYIRANAAGAVRVLPFGNSTSITLDLVAGEFVPCLVKRVFATGTDVASMHVFY